MAEQPAFKRVFCNERFYLKFMLREEI